MMVMGWGSVHGGGFWGDGGVTVCVVCAREGGGSWK